MNFLGSAVCVLALVADPCVGFGFLGQPVQQAQYHQHPSRNNNGGSFLEMRKQKASDKRTRRQQQRGNDLLLESGTVTQSPMNGKAWRQRQATNNIIPETKTGGRGRSRKRSALYNSLSLYHNKYLSLLTQEYRQEEDEVLERIKASLDDPLGYEAAGFALFDMHPERRGNLFSDEVYRLVKANDATTTFPESGPSLNDDKDDETSTSSSQSQLRFLPPNHKISSNDVIMITLQPQGSGDFFNLASLPTQGLAIEARVLNTGPTYVDIAVPNGSFEAAFGPPTNDNKMRLRVDRFFSNIPYQRMVTALAQLTAIPERKEATTATASDNDSKKDAHERICMDELLREVVLSTHAYSDPFSAYYNDDDFLDLQYLSSCLAKPPVGSSLQMAKKAITFMKSDNQQIFEEFNQPQLAAINAALTRRLTLIQGPPGTGKTSVASAIGFGFAYQCKMLSAAGNAKVLACACSNVGADNLADRLVKLGLKVVRIGRPSAVSESLWDHTLDAAIDRDPDAQNALKHAARATAALRESQKSNNKSRGGTSSGSIVDVTRDIATAAVKASIKACNIAATKALREADIVVSTSTGASDPRLLAACGISTDPDDAIDASGRNGEDNKAVGRGRTQDDRLKTAPDGLPPLSCPFVIIDESCQSVEPASIIPMTSTNSCRALVLLGDPCQLPPTVRSGDEESPLAVSLMARLAEVLPHPTVPLQPLNGKECCRKYLDALPVKQARSRFQSLSQGETQQGSYRKRYGGSILLSVQYRMHPSISALPSAIFYDSLLATPAFLANSRQMPQFLRQSMPCDDQEFCVRFVDVGGRNNERKGAPKGYAKAAAQSAFFSEKEQSSYWNEPEADAVVSLVRDAVNAAVGDPSSPKSIGIVTPYRGQVDLIKKKLAADEELAASTKMLSIEVEIKTVDGYQGRERDLILFSAVRSNRKGNIGFLRDWRRTNVALTRARSALVVVGDLETLRDGDRHWAAFGKYCEETGCVFSGTVAEDC
ncbi:polymerase alpha-associated DNA helicase A [Seminavis robusta]|uniref:Polymerase alpha-associated DNA helicase A n=1 Tax=Seminavis robusta TaxID=568900 RepID=A0A9N8D9W6_9STRA|nr:polymerase alpha-associated DNA helicase A [Seminavis robusta]|eukprot:Sro11_g008790.1 polymerase alpha-associated DNA helicase A (997) ;mRNA; r:156575-160086